MRGRRPGIVVLLSTLGGCQPNPRNEIAAIAEAAMVDVVRTSPGQATCVERVIAPWRAPGEAARYDPPAPPGLGDLYAAGVFRGGGGLKGASVAGLPLTGGGPGCVALAGPLVAGDRAMIEVRLGEAALNNWLRRTDGDWRVVMTTSSSYRR